MQKISKLIKKEKCYSILIILIASIFMCAPLMNSQIDMTYDDGIQHICRLIGTYQGIRDGNSLIFENFCNGFGYSWNLFYSPLTAYLPLIFTIFSIGFATCIKLFMFAVVFLSGYYMYIFVKKVTKNNNIAILASIFYILAPYRFTDMYVRNALAELTSFVFMPVIFLGLYNLFDDVKDYKKVHLPIIIGSVGLILTHNVIALYTAILVFIYVIVNVFKMISSGKKYYKEHRKVLYKYIKTLLISLVLILLLTAFYYIPLLELKWSANYEVFRPGRMERTEVLTAYKLDFYRLFYTKTNDYMVYEIGILVLIGLIFTPAVIKKIKHEKYYKTYLYMLILGIVLAIMTLKVFPFEKMPSMLKMIQFSFRLLEFTSFFFSFVAAVNFVVISKKFEIREVLILTLIMLLLSTIFNGHVRTLDNYDEQKLIDTIPVTSQTGRVHAGCASFEYLPTKAFENRSYIEERNQDVIVLEGEAQIKNIDKNKSVLKFDIENSKDQTMLELPYIYYPGYRVILRYDIEKYELDTFETDNGFVGVTIPEFSYGKVDVTYVGTSLMNISKIISISTLVILIIYVVNKKYRLRNKVKIDRIDKTDKIDKINK